MIILSQPETSEKQLHFAALSKLKDTVGENLIKQAADAKVPDLPNMKYQLNDEHDHSKMIISKRYHASFGPFGQTFGASVRG